MPEITNNSQITSPEQLNSYIRVTSTGVWIVLASVMIFLLGFFVWIFFGELKNPNASYQSAESYTVRPITFLLK